MGELFRCSYCPCAFCSELDLERHMEVFGKNKAKHMSKFRKVHGDKELEVFLAHGGADRIVSILARIIEGERRVKVVERKEKVKPRVRELFDNPSD